MKQTIIRVIIVVFASACTLGSLAGLAAVDDPLAFAPIRASVPAPAPGPVPVPVPAPVPASAPEFIPLLPPPTQLPTALPAVVDSLCDFYRNKPFAERVTISFVAPGKREQQSTITVRSRGGGKSDSANPLPAAAIPELLVEAGPLLLLITPATITVVPVCNDDGRPIYWSTLVATISGSAPHNLRIELPTHNELARLIAPLPLPQLALMQPDAADRFLSSEGLSLLFQLPGAQAQTFSASTAAIAGRAQIGSRSKTLISQTSDWTGTLFPESARLRSLKVAYSGGTLQLAISPIDGPDAAAEAAPLMSTTGRRRVAELAELGRTLTTAALGDAAMALGDFAITTPGKVSSADGVSPPRKIAQLIAHKPGPVVLMIHRPTLDAAKSSVKTARELIELLEKSHPGQTQILRLSGADPALATPEPVLSLSSQQLDRLLGDYEAVLVVVSSGPECIVLAKTGLLPGQTVGAEIIARFSQLLLPP